MTEKAQYKAVRGSVLSDEQAAIYGGRIEEIVAANGGHIVAEDVLSDARNHASPLHQHFEWDDQIAATSYRLNQARYLLRSINVIVDTPDGAIETRAFHSVVIDTRSEEGITEATRVTVTISRVLDEAALRAQVVEGALRQIRSWQQKYKQYSELAPLIVAIEQSL